MGRNYKFKTTLFILGFITLMFADINMQGDVKNGTVTSSEDGIGLSGVNVIVKGTLNAIITDIDDVFEVKTQTTDTVLFSYIGYVSEIENKAEVNTLLQALIIDAAANGTFAFEDALDSIQLIYT